MIILLDNYPHCETSIAAIKQWSNEEIHLIELPHDMTIGQSRTIATQLLDVVDHGCVVICPWCVKSDATLDEIFTNITKICPVIAATGNFSREIEYYSPAKAYGVTAVGALNKSGEHAKFSNFSNLKLITWVPGTNIIINGKPCTGTSVACVLYGTALLEANRTNTFITDIIDKYTKEELRDHI